jgi:hypothetical protein
MISGIDFLATCVIEITPSGNIGVHCRRSAARSAISSYPRGKTDPSARLDWERAANLRPRKPPKPVVWNVYKFASKAVWLGAVEAPDEVSAMEKDANLLPRRRKVGAGR